MSTTNIDSVPFVFDASGKWATLTQDLHYAHGSIAVTVPAGFKTDFSSIPRLLWSILPKLDRHILAAVIHDYLYATATFDRVIADAIFLSAMRALKVPGVKRWPMYLGVRLFGWMFFGKRRKR